MSKSDLVVVAALLRPDEARMLRELLESAGITATTFNAGLGSTAQWDPATGVAKVAVLPDDVEHAQEIIRSSGVVPGPGPERPIEIPEKEWRASALTDQRETPDTIAYQVDCIRHPDDGGIASCEALERCQQGTEGFGALHKVAAPPRRSVSTSGTALNLAWSP